MVRCSALDTLPSGRVSSDPPSATPSSQALLPQETPTCPSSPSPGISLYDAALSRIQLHFPLTLPP